MSEKYMRQFLVSTYRHLDMKPVENAVGPGTPDVNYIEGWVELKEMDKWTRDCETKPFLINHFTPQQRVWLSRRARRGGRVFLLLKVAQDWLLYDGSTASTHVGRVSKPELFRLAKAHWNPFNKKELESWLTKGKGP